MIEVMSPGLLTTVQDIGRCGLQRYGVIVSGAMDSVALRIANLLVGNEEDEACLEMTLLGPELTFLEDTLIAVTGDGLSPTVYGKEYPGWRPMLVRAGTVVKFLPRSTGCRSYLAVAGGVVVPKVMGSASTYLRAAIGGYEGRPLRAGDKLQTAPPQDMPRRLVGVNAEEGPVAVANWRVSLDVLPRYHQRQVIRVVWGTQKDLFSMPSLTDFQTAPFTVTSQSDRMGYRLQGPRLELREPHELISEAVATGTIQVPPEGNPIVLMADHQTTGGYPKIAQVVSVDIPVLAQVRPGESVRFEVISIKQAQHLLREQEEEIQAFQCGLHILRNVRDFRPNRL